jgi:NADH dehydrogenase/NADH:ubiquinone oxidoreductase subunit G
MERRVELLAEKLSLLDDVYELTKAEDFGGVMDEEKAERYMALYETREPLMECVAAIDGELAELGGALADEAIREKAKAIYELDGVYRKSASAFAESIKTDIRSLKKGRAANDAYMTEIYSDGGTVLDKRN